jgi:hypothetical protein
MLNGGRLTPYDMVGQLRLNHHPCCLIWTDGADAGTDRQERDKGEEKVERLSVL